MKKILTLLFAAAMLTTVSCTKGETNETKGETNPVETKTAETLASETTAEETDEADSAETEGTETAAPYDYLNNDLAAFITLGNYKGLSVTARSAELTEAEYQTALTELLDSYAEYEKITDRAVAEGDTVVTSYSGYLNGVQFEGGTSESSSVTAKDGAGYIDGFGPAFIGQMPGVEFSFNVTFPETYGNADLAGKEVTFVCTVSHIEGEDLIVPALTDEFVIDNFGYLNVAEFEEAFRDYNSEQKKYEVESEINEELWNQLLENSAIIGYPEGEVDRYVELIRADMEQTAAMYGFEFTDFLLYYAGMSEEEFAETAKIQAEGYVKENLIIYQIAKEQNITVTDEQFNKEVEAIAEMNGVTGDVILNYYGEDNLRLSFLQEEIFKVVLGFADVTAEETSSAE